MKAVVFESFGGKLNIQDVKKPMPKSHGVVIRVKATGVCRSDWHGWMGHDDGINLPHVPGHEFAGVVESVGSDVKRFKAGDKVTVLFISACGRCSECSSGNHQVCGNQTQPGFTHWGSFAEYVEIDFGDVNLVHLPEEIDYVTAASLGCRFATSFRAVVDQGKVSAGQWVAVHGCGGVGLSAVMIASSIGANVIAVDISDDALALAQKLGADVVINAKNEKDVSATIKRLSSGGAHVSIDALGNPITCVNSVNSLRKRGKHVQVGLLLAEQSTPPIPMDTVVAHELEVIGSHGMQAYRYEAMFGMIATKKLNPQALIGKIISLQEAPKALTEMDKYSQPGVTVISFDEK